MWHNIKQLKGMHWAVSFLLGVLATMVGVALTVYWLAIFRPFDTRPLDVTVLDDGINGRELCPGDTIVSTLRSHVEGAVIIDVFWGIVDEDGDGTALGAYTGSLLKPPGLNSTITRRFEWTVPPLSPGPHTGLRGYWVLGDRSPPYYLEIPFVVRAGCQRQAKKH